MSTVKYMKASAVGRWGVEISVPVPSRHVKYDDYITRKTLSVYGEI